MSVVFLVALVALSWMPGHLLLRLSGIGELEPPRWCATERLFGEIALSVVLLLWIAVVLGLLGAFSPLALVGAAGMLTGVLAQLVMRRQDLFGRPGFRPDAALLIVVALVVACGMLYRPGFEQVAGGRDPLTYVISGIHLAEQGSWVVQDDVVTEIDVDERRTFLGTVRAGDHGHWGARFLGWYLMDPDTGRVVPQGLPLYPTAIAVGYLIGGVQAAVSTTTLLAVVAVVGLFFLGRRLHGTATGLTAAVWLLASPAQVWFSRYANAETVAQLLVVLGLYGFLMYRKHGLGAYGLLASVAFGLTWLAHIWMVWLVLPLAGIFVVDLLRGRVDGAAVRAFWGPLTVLGGQALLVYFTITTAYLWGVYSVLRWSLPAVVPALVAAGLILAVAWYWGRRRSAATSADPERKGRLGWSRPVAAAVLVLAAAFAYAIRPQISNAWAAEAVPRLTLTTGLPLFALAVLGIVALLLDRRRGEAMLSTLVVALGIVVPVLWHPSIQRQLMWSLRRYQTFLPLVYLFAAVALWWWASATQRGGSGKRWLRYATIAVALLLLVPQARQGWAYRGFKQPGNTIALVEDIAASLEPDAVLLFEARSGWGVLDFAAPLAYWKGFEVYRLHAKRPEFEDLRDLVLRQAQRDRPVYFFTQGFTYFFRTPRAVPHRQWWYVRRQLEEVRERMPQRVIDSRFLFSVYRLEPRGVNGPLDVGLNVGTWDDIFVEEALPTEIVGPFSTRWTRARSRFWLPGMPEDARRIVVHADTVGDSERLGRRLRARLNGVEMGEIPIVAGWRDYIFDVPSGWPPVEGEVPMLELSTEAIQPDAVSGNGDTRYLGVLVNAVLWQ